MILRKTAVAVAIAGIAAAPMAATAETTISGIVQLQIKGEAIGNISDNLDDVADEVGDDIADAVDGEDEDDGDEDSLPDTDDEDLNIGAGDVRVNILSTHELNNGLEGYGNVGLTLDDLLNEQNGVKPVDAEETADIDESEDLATIKADNVYVGIKGGFGDVRIGEIPLVVEYGQLANDIFDVTGDIGDGLSYTGVFGPATIGINYALEAPNFGPDSDMVGAGFKVAFGGVTLGAGVGQHYNQGDAGDDQLRYSAGVAFAYAGFSFAGQFWSREAIDGAADDTNSIGAKVGYGFGDISTNLTYEQIKDDIELADQSAIRLDIVYDLGGGMDISTRITSFTADEELAEADEKTEYRLQFSKAF